MKKSNLIIFLFSFKYFLDLISPNREFNFILLNVIFFLVLVINVDDFKFLNKREIFISVFLIFFFIYWSILQRDYLSLFRYSSLILIYFTMRLLFLRLNSFQVINITKRLIKIFFLFLLLNFFISIAKYNPLNREFYNFEHANLLGSYILLPLVFIYYLADKKSLSFRSKLSIPLASMFSTSTGSFISSLFVFLDIKNVKAKTILYFIIIFTLFITFLYYITGNYFNSLHMKIFSPVELVFNGGFSELSYLAQFKLPVQELGEEYSSSLIWRFYAYIIFFEYIINQNFLSLLLGNGFGGFLDVWNGIAPHNDFIFILIDFGLLFFIFTLYFFTKTLSYLFKCKPIFIPLFLILLLRLLFENNLISYYLLSGIVMHFLFLFLILKRDRQ